MKARTLVSILKETGYDITLKDLRSLTTTVVKETGPSDDYARLQLRHSPSSRTAEEYYLRIDKREKRKELKKGMEEWVKEMRKRANGNANEKS